MFSNTMDHMCTTNMFLNYDAYQCWGHMFTTTCNIQAYAVPELDKERPQANPLVRPLTIPHHHDWRKIEVCLINFNKGEDDDGCLTFCNILKWSATAKGKLLKGCLESTLRYDSISVKVQ